jgi:2-iminoacetate synthase ThiH
MGRILEVVMEIHFRDINLEPVWQKVRKGNRLSAEDGLRLLATNDIISLGKMAHFVQKLCLESKNRTDERLCLIV